MLRIRRLREVVRGLRSACARVLPRPPRGAGARRSAPREAASASCCHTPTRSATAVRSSRSPPPHRPGACAPPPCARPVRGPPPPGPPSGGAASDPVRQEGHPVLGAPQSDPCVDGPLAHRDARVRQLVAHGGVRLILIVAVGLVVRDRPAGALEFRDRGLPALRRLREESSPSPRPALRAVRAHRRRGAAPRRRP